MDPQNPYWEQQLWEVVSHVMIKLMLGDKAYFPSAEPRHVIKAEHDPSVLTVWPPGVDVAVGLAVDVETDVGTDPSPARYQ